MFQPYAPTFFNLGKEVLTGKENSNLIIQIRQDKELKIKKNRLKNKILST
jgi:hypothetical protein